MERKIESLEENLQSNSSKISQLETNMSIVSEDVETVQEWKNDFISWSLQITGIIAGIFAIILAVYVAVIQREIILENYNTVIFGALLVLIILVATYIIMFFKKK